LREVISLVHPVYQRAPGSDALDLQARIRGTRRAMLPAMSTSTWSPPNNDEIRKHTSATSNARIDRETERAVAAALGSRAALQTRLAELDREWNVDRALMLNFAVLGGLSASLTMRSLARSRRLGGWGALFFTQIAFLAHHAIRRWCPPMPVFRRLGFRSQREIDRERQVLEARLSDPGNP
jgi:hypothetical protein